MMNLILTNKETARHGYITMTGYYKQVCKNQETAVYRTVRERAGFHLGIPSPTQLLLLCLFKDSSHCCVADEYLDIFLTNAFENYVITTS